MPFYGLSLSPGIKGYNVIVRLYEGTAKFGYKKVALSLENMIVKSI